MAAADLDWPKWAVKKYSGHEFRQWLSLLSEKLFVNLVVYADESGTHEPSGKQEGSAVAVMAGYAAKGESWVKFRKDWQAVLKRFRAPYFHFSEWAAASAVARKIRPPTSGYKDNPYCGWPLEKLDEFLYALATIAGAGSKVPVGGYFDTRKYASDLKSHPEESFRNSHHEGCVWPFYESVIKSVRAKWPRLKEPVAFIYDQSDNVEWRKGMSQR